MERLPILIRGIIIGFSIAAPVGPIGVLCMRRTLAKGFSAGLVSGLGAATADAVYGVLAGFGLAFVSGFLLKQHILLRLAGAIFLLYLGIRTFTSKPAGEIDCQEKRMVGDYASTFFLTITNPATIMSFAAIFAGLGLGSTRGDYASAILLVVGVFSGSALWWLILSGTMSMFHRRMSYNMSVWVNRGSGLILFAFGALIFASLHWR